MHPKSSASFGAGSCKGPAERDSTWSYNLLPFRILALSLLAVMNGELIGVRFMSVCDGVAGSERSETAIRAMPAVAVAIVKSWPIRINRLGAYVMRGFLALLGSNQPASIPSTGHRLTPVRRAPTLVAT